MATPNDTPDEPQATGDTPTEPITPAEPGTPAEPVTSAEPGAPEPVTPDPAATQPFETVQPGGYQAAYPLGLPGFPTAGPAGPAPSGNRLSRAWSRATATTGGKVVTILGLGVASFAVVFLVAALAFGIARHNDDRSAVGFDRRGTDGQSQLGNGQGNGNGYGDPNGGNQGGMPGQGMPGQNGQGMPGQGMPGQDGDRGMGGLGAFGLNQALHGEFVIGGTTPTSYLFQRGQVTKASDTSIDVKSADGFTATYAVDSSTRTNLSAAPAVGTSVAVLATKDGAKAVIVRQVGSQSSQGGFGNGA